MREWVVGYLGGPCNGNVAGHKWDRPPATTRCGGADYRLDPGKSEGSTLVYVAVGSKYDNVEPAEVRHKRDVYRAWHRLMRILSHNVPGELHRVRRAGHRIRRAVK